jgi:predicted glycogen debranching enzyme
MEDVLNQMPWAGKNARELEPLLTREWLVTNGLGGYASGTVAGVATRRFHGLLVAALSGPLGRVMMLNHLSEQLRLPNGTTVLLGGEERARPDTAEGNGASGLLEVPGAGYLTEFRLEAGLPVFCYNVEGYRIEKRLHLPHMQNTVYITYRVLEGDGTLRLKLRPSVHFRPHEAPVNTSLGSPYVLTAVENCYELTHGGGFSFTTRADQRPGSEPAGMPPLRMKLDGERSAFTVDGRRIPPLLYRIEESRGYESTGDLWSPGHFRVDLRRGGPATLIASTESWATIRALTPEEALKAELERRRRLLHLAPPVAHAGVAAELVLAADQFIITPAGRAEEAARARAAGDEVRTVIAGYHWFTDWGRDTMICLDGLTLVTGRHVEAGYILRTFAHYIRDGLIPNLFPEGEQEGLYHTADATLWFFHALARYVEVTGDRMTLRLVLPKLMDIVEHHLAGTRFHIGVDPRDGLLRQGQEGYQLTWMDAKVGDWVVTPRRGKAVEINALWYNALRLLERWVREEPDVATRSPGRSHAERRNEGAGALPAGEAASKVLAGYAERVYRSFNERFWNPERGYLYDVVDGRAGNDPACRPNQVFAISLPHPVLEPGRWKPVLAVVREKLLTPVGLRSLSPDHPDYKPRYYGDLRARDAAYHQGTVWAWLIGPFIDAWLKVHPGDQKTAAHFLEGFKAHLGEACLGTISEIFDAGPPFTPRGCAAQAWSVAEVLRSWVRLARDGVRP